MFFLLRLSRTRACTRRCSVLFEMKLRRSYLILFLAIAISVIAHANLDPFMDFLSQLTRQGAWVELETKILSRGIVHFSG